MTGWLIAAAMLTVVVALLSFDEVRDAVRTDVYLSLDRWLERWLQPLLSVITLICIGMAMRTQTGPVIQDPPSPPSMSTDTAAPGPAAATAAAASAAVAPLSAATPAAVTEERSPAIAQPVVAQFRIVARGLDGAPTAGISGVEVRVGQDRSATDAEGRVKLTASTRPSPDALMHISHPEYVPHFLPFRDLGSADAGSIEIKPVMRIVAIDTAERPSGGAAGTSPTTSAPPTGAASTRHAFESAFVRKGLELVTNEKERGEIVTQLYRYAEGRALYDPRTLQNLGMFRAASHAAFITVEQGPHGVRKATARLVSFKTTVIEQIVEVDEGDRASASDAGRILAERLLSQIAELRILNPRTATGCGGPVVALDGFGLFVPERWKIWISVQPQGLARHFPQLPVTLQADGSWSAAEVNVGETRTLARGQTFKVYAVLADEQHSREISEYLTGGNNLGLDLSRWNERSYRVLDNITIVRRPDAPSCT
jgi:hypothetical protein